VTATSPTAHRVAVSWLQCLLVELVSIAGMYVSARFGIALGLPERSIAGLLWIGGSTPLVFGFFLSRSRAWWKRPPFWAITVLFATAHLLSFANLFLRHKPPGRWA
jgi:hypothetical protein